MVNVINSGDMFSVPCLMLINPVNRAGISGGGLAKEFERRFPDHERMWRICNTFPMKKGQLFYCCFGSMTLGDLSIMYFPTKHEPKDRQSDPVLILENLHKLKSEMEHLEPHINMPALGCGLGGLDFEGWLKPLVLEMFEHEPYTINLFAPQG